MPKERQGGVLVRRTRCTYIVSSAISNQGTVADETKGGEKRLTRGCLLLYVWDLTRGDKVLPRVPGEVFAEVLRGRWTLQENAKREGLGAFLVKNCFLFNPAAELVVNQGKVCKWRCG